MRREVSCEGDRGKATRVATRFDAVAEITDEHFAGYKLRLTVDKRGRWYLFGRLDNGAGTCISAGWIKEGLVTID